MKTDQPNGTAETFQTAYADALLPVNASDEQWKAAVSTRQLRWQGKRTSLDEAYKLYALFSEYNKFRADMLLQLQRTFPQNQIEVTPARECSVCMYLWIPDGLMDQVVEYIESNWNADEIDEWPNGSLRVWWD